LHQQSKDCKVLLHPHPNNNLEQAHHTRFFKTDSFIKIFLYDTL